jgi:hypothetical protein
MRTVRVAPFAVAAMAFVTVAQGAVWAKGEQPLTVPVHVTKDDVNPGRTYSAPFLLAHPDDPNTIVGSFIELRTNRCGLIRTTDAGRTWQRAATAPALESFPFCLMPNSNIFHGPLAWGRDNTLYYALAGWDFQDGSTQLGNISVQLARSTNLGDTWETTLVRNARGKEGADLENNRPLGGIGVDSKSGKDDILYVAWQSRASGQRTGSSQVPDRPFVAVSFDGGKTFGDPVLLSAGVYTDEVRAEAFTTATTQPPAPGVPAPTTTVAPAGSKAATPNQPDNFGGRNPFVLTDGKGNAYVFWHSVTSNLTPSPSMANFLSKSTDKGKTWTTTKIAPFDPRNGLATTRLLWSPEGGPDGTLHLVQQGSDTPQVANYQTVYYRRSTDGGRTWSDRRALSDHNPRLLQGQYAPNISLAPGGRLDVAWWDTRDDRERGNDVYYTYSTDNGDTWSPNRRITDQTVNRRYGVWSNNFDMSSPPGLASTREYAMFGWDDTRLTDRAFADTATTGGGIQDIFTASVQFSALGGGSSSAAKIALAAAGGLVAVGLILVAVTVAGRRRAGPPARMAEEAADPAAVG